jgi:tetratricopeptide (TPR) repeat protein
MKRKFCCNWSIFILICLILLCHSACQTIRDQKPFEKDGKLYGVTEGTFRHNWWNYYERALSYADGGFREEAELDLRNAIQQRKNDQRRARTYGMHFIDYFPHRELGVVLYNQKKYDVAVQELEASLAMEKSAKGELYLDRARKALIDERHLDKQPPQIIIKYPEKSFVTNALSVSVEGIARDDTYVRHIKIGGKDVRVDISAREIPFKIDVPLIAGENRIPIAVTDLSGKTSLGEVTVMVGRLGPVIRIDEPSEGDPIAGPSLTLKGYAYSESGLDELTVNGRRISLDGSPEVQIRELISLRPEEGALTVKVKDRAGNATTAVIALARGEGSSNLTLKGYAYGESGLDELTVNLREVSLDESPEVKIRELISLGPDERVLKVAVKDRAENATTAVITLASGEGLSEASRIAVQKDTIPPLISLRDQKQDYVTYLDQALIEGNIRDNDRVEGLFINGKSILKEPGKNIYFSHLVELKEGENVVTIRGVDRSGNARTESLRIKRDIPKVRQVGSRLRVGVNNFEKKSVGEDRQYSYGLEDILSSSMLKRARFSVIDRRELKAIMEELKISQSGLVDEKTALKIGKILAADTMLLGSVLERINSLEIYARLLDTETAEVLAIVDVYGEDIDIGLLRSLCQGVDLRLTEEMPLVEGIVLKVDGKRLAVDLGKNYQMKRGLKVIIYDIGKEIRHPVTQKVVGLDIKEYGEARIESVMDEMSFMEMTGRGDAHVIRPMYRVITR